MIPVPPFVSEYLGSCVALILASWRPRLIGSTSPEKSGETLHCPVTAHITVVPSSLGFFSLGMNFFRPFDLRLFIFAILIILPTISIKKFVDGFGGRSLCGGVRGAVVQVEAVARSSRVHVPSRAIQSGA